MGVTGRPEKSIDPTSGPLGQLALDLKAVRRRSTLTLAQLATHTGLSVATLSAAALGQECPSWQTLRAYLAACGEDADDWRPRWEMLASEHQRLQAGVPERPEQRRVVLQMTPDRVRTVQDLKLALRHLRAREGNPPYKSISRRPNLQGSIAISTISVLLSPKNDRLPTLEVLMVFLAALGIRHHTAEFRRWLDAWHRLAMNAQTNLFGRQQPTLAA
ncbi:helix-turn-helix domain-containing protein [Streptomyces sp. NPDC051913]|uniref:helix-turn-helix domain-containing protein n=1 Tax=Streptomyces sp. NPDC051913 TaxID=3365676 RepID=UPI0037D372A9